MLKMSSLFLLTNQLNKIIIKSLLKFHAKITLGFFKKTHFFMQKVQHIGKIIQKCLYINGFGDFGIKKYSEILQDFS